MSTPHLGANPGDIAEAVLLPGDPLRAKFIAENYLEHPVCYNTVRNMLGYTGTYKGKRVSVQGTGMGVPSISIYVSELLMFYGVKKLIRIGTCGAMQESLNLRDVVLAISSSTDSAVNKLRFKGMDFAPTADPELLFKAWTLAKERGMGVTAGNILTSDTFYGDEPDGWKIWAAYGVLAAEMETTALYTLAAKHKAQALTILTVSDSIVTGESSSSEDRQLTFRQMMELALDTI